MSLSEELQYVFEAANNHSSPSAYTPTKATTPRESHIVFVVIHTGNSGRQIDQRHTLGVARPASFPSFRKCQGGDLVIQCIAPLAEACITIFFQNREQNILDVSRGVRPGIKTFHV